MGYVIYCAVNEITGKAYVGQTKHALAKRKQQHEKSACAGRSSGVFAKALNKYGAAAFTWFELEQLDTVDAANEREAHHIASVGTLVPHGYNLDSGGRNKTTHKDTRQRISASCKGRVSPNAGRRLSEEHRRSLSKAHTGKVLSFETRAKVSEALRNRPVSSETRKKISDSRKDKLPVTLKNYTTGEVVSFESQYAASRALSLPQSSVNKLVRGVYKSTGGWRLYTPPV